MHRHIRKSIRLLTAIPALILVTSQISANEIQEFHAEEFWYDTAGTQIDVVTPFEFKSAELRLRKRGESEVWTESFGPGVSLSVDLAQVITSGLTDDRYTYEVSFVTGYKPGEMADDHAVAADEPVSFRTSGSFSVQDGSITDIRVPGHRTLPAEKGGEIQSGSTHQASGDASLMDVTDSGDLAIGGYGVFGSDDTNDVISGKLRVLADSSGIASLSVQSEASNGDDYAWHFGTQTGGDFALQRQRTVSGAKTTVLGIEEDSPQHSLAISSDGRIGFGTSTPQNRLHIIGSGSGTQNPRLRLENTTHEQEWLVGAWSTNQFVIRNDTDGRTVFSADTNAPTNTLALRTNGVGVGTSSPQAPLHVRRTDGTAEILLEETQAIATNTMFTMRHNGNPGFRMENTDQATAWEFRLGGSGSTEQFTINNVSIPEPELSVLANGSIRIKGSYLSGSSRKLKQDIVETRASEILTKLSQLPLYEWSYKTAPNTRHIGPMAEDYYEIFGLAGEGEGLAATDVASIALVATKELQQQNSHLEEQNKELLMRIQRLESVIDNR